MLCCFCQPRPNDDADGASYDEEDGDEFDANNYVDDDNQQDEMALDGSVVPVVPPQTPPLQHVEDNDKKDESKLLASQQEKEEGVKMDAEDDEPEEVAEDKPSAAKAKKHPRTKKNKYPIPASMTKLIQIVNGKLGDTPVVLDTDRKRTRDTMYVCVSHWRENKEMFQVFYQIYCSSNYFQRKWKANQKRLCCIFRQQYSLLYFLLHNILM